MKSGSNSDYLFVIILTETVKLFLILRGSKIQIFLRNVFSGKKSNVTGSELQAAQHEPGSLVLPKLYLYT